MAKAKVDLEGTFLNIVSTAVADIEGLKENCKDTEQIKMCDHIAAWLSAVKSQAAIFDK